MDDLSFDILTHAVMVAKNEQIKSHADLFARLASLYPDNAERIDRAIVFWANSIVRQDVVCDRMPG